MQEKIYNVPAVSRAVKILDYIKKNKEVSFSAMQNNLDIPKGSLYQIISTLKANNFIELNDGIYELGIKLFELGEVVKEKFDIKKTVLPVLKELTEKTMLTSHLGVWHRGEAYFIEQVRNSSRIIIQNTIGERICLFSSATGKILFAYQSKEEQKKIIEEIQFVKRTENTINNKDDLNKELKRIREQGYSIDNQESHELIFGIGMPIYNLDHKVKSAISIGGLVTEINKDNYKNYITDLEDASKKLSAIIND